MLKMRKNSEPNTVAECGSDVSYTAEQRSDAAADDYEARKPLWLRNAKAWFHAYIGVFWSYC